jgi:hypothetical protein
MRLCVHALIPKRQGGFESTNVIFIDAGGGNNSDVYQCVNFARQYGLNIKKVLQSIMITRAFTIYQLADLIIYQLPRIVQQFNTKVIVVVISDLLNMFTQQHDPNIDYKEAIFLIRGIINSIKNTLENILVVVFFRSNSIMMITIITNHIHMTIFFFQDLINTLKLQIITVVKLTC